MFNPVLGELIARERYNDYVRQAEQDQLANAAIANKPARHFNLRIALGKLVLAARHLFDALACRSGIQPCNMPAKPD